MMPVVAQSLLFPNNEDSLAFAIDPATGAQTPTNLADHIQGANGGVLTLAPGMVQDKNVFKKQREVTDANGRVRDIQYTGGKLETTAVGVIPFRVSGPKFVAESCAKSLKVRIAIGNWCTTSTNAGQDNRADIWIGDMTPLFNDPGVMPNGFETSPFWPTLTVDRDLAANPLDGACGAGYDIAVQPSEADIDAHLPIKGFWPN